MRDGERNVREGWCRRCRGLIAPGEGILRKRALVHVETCPEPEEIVRPNRYPGACDLCDGWIGAGEGVAVRQDTATVTGARYSARHDPYCPATVTPAPDSAGFTGVWIANSVGIKDPCWDPHPWVRELTTGAYGEQRYRWIRGRRDYSDASPDGSRGITTSFTLRHGRLYEAECVVETPGHGKVERARGRMFLRLTSEGDVELLAEESAEVRSWLAAG